MNIMQAPSTVNDCARLMMASIRTQFNEMPWFNWGYNVTRASGTSIQVTTASANTVTIDAVFYTGGRLKFFDTTTMYGTITTVSSSAVATTVSFTPDSGELSASFTSVANSILNEPAGSGSSLSIPADLIRQSGAQIYGADGGATDAYAISLSPSVTSLATGQLINFYANTANTGNATLSVNGLAAVNILKNKDQTLASGDIKAGQIVTVVYDGTNLQMQSQTASGFTAATKAQQEVGTSNAVSVTPAVQQYHNSAAKGWVEANTIGGFSSCYNVTSITDTSTGLATITWTVPFVSSSYTTLLSIRFVPAGTAASTLIGIVLDSGYTANQVSVVSLSAATFNGADPNYYEVSAFGVQ